MSLLDRGNATITVYPEVERIDRDGNTITEPAKTGYPLRVMIQPRGQSGTSARRAEQDNEGFETEKEYRMRPVRGAAIIGAQARIEWEGQYWAVHGDPTLYNGSWRTRRHEYTIRRT